MGMESPVRDGLDAQKVHFIDVDGIRTRYYEDGTGEPLLLLHGGQFASLYSLDGWSLNLPGLARRFRVIALDKLGQGHTDNPPDDEYTVAALIRHTQRFLALLGIRRAHLVGHSRGAFLATCLVQEDPEVAKTLVMVDTNTTAPENPQYPSGVFYDNLAKRTPPGPPTRATVRMEPEAQSVSFDHITMDFVDRMYEIAVLPKAAVAKQRMQALKDTVWLPGLNRRRAEVVASIEEKGLPVPTLIMWGFNDRSAPLPLGLDLLSRICPKTPATEMHVFNRAGHYSYREHPAEFDRLLTEFCTRY